MAAKKTASAPRKTAQAKNAAAPKQRTAAGPRSARKTGGAGDEVVTIDRRRASHRPETQETAPAPLPERRAKVQRRRQIDPTTCERDYSDDETDFMKAMDRYKRENRRPFPTWSEVLEVMRSLGYRKVAEPTDLPGTKKPQAAADAAKAP